MRSFPVLRPILAALVLLGWAATPAAAATIATAVPHFTYVDLGTLGGSFSSPAAINGKRQVVGRSTRSNSPECIGPDSVIACEYAFAWQEGTMTDLGHANPQGQRSFPSALNDDGVIVGYEELALDAGHGGGTVLVTQPFIRSHGEFRPLPLLSSNPLATGLANAINAAGTVTGFSEETNSAQTLVTWANEAVQRGEVQKGIYRRGQGINDSGTIAGWQYMPRSFRPTNGFVQSRGVVINLSADDENIWSEALDVNASGLVVGNKADRAFAAGLATTWREVDGKLVTTRVGALKGHDHSSLAKVNRQGEAVGYSEDSTRPGRMRAVAVIGGRMVDLNALVKLRNVVLTQATGINDLGDIVGEATARDGSVHAFVLLRR